ncbi:MAG: hydantoinase/oxoprolinase family protein [Ruminococcaceae bacterium]|nr:hydantoinase/oxoprolinase family protein [Oscillospiraceae bacterium]
MSERKIRIGVDVGGTNTDICAIDENTGKLMVYKLPSSLYDQSEAVVEGIKAISDEYDFSGNDVSRFIHGTTVATNAILEGRGAKTALVTTKGFRDLLEIGRQRRPDLYNLQTDKPRTLISRDLRYEVDERTDYKGEVLTELREEEIECIISECKEKGVEAVAIMLLNSYVNPQNENKISEIFKKHYPNIFLTVSGDLSKQFREYERLCGTVINSFVGPEVKKYMNNLKKTLEDNDIHKIYINHSNGGLMSIAESVKYPVKTALSGPAAGVVGTRYITELIGENNLITVDIGGTSTDISLVIDGKFESSDEKTISGYPVRIPSIDISTIGAGGGSIAWVDNGGALKVGPQSAGSSPGPACYDKGGESATITDARVVLGHLNNETLLGGRLPINAELSKKAVQKLADKLNMGLTQTARGIVMVSNSNIVKEIKNVTVSKGYNPSELCLVAFGGSGPLHAAELIEEMAINKALIPKTPGLLAAYGLLTENMRRDFVQTCVMDLSENCEKTLTEQMDKLKKEAELWFEQENISKSLRYVNYFLDMRYKGQNYEIRVPVNEEQLSSASNLIKEFKSSYERLYSFSTDDVIQIVNFGLSATGDIVYPVIKEDGYAGKNAENAVIGARKVYDDNGDTCDYTLYDREKLHNGNIIYGPAIIEQMDSTTIVFANQKATVDKHLNIMIERR